MRHYYAIILTAILLMVLTGCGRLDLVIHEDGSGEGKYEVELTGKFTAQDVKEGIEKGLAEVNDKAGQEVIRLEEFEEKDGMASATVAFDSLTALSGGKDTLLVTVDDIRRLDPQRLDALIDVDKHSAIKPEDLDKIGDKPVVYLNIDDETEITVTVPGRILYAAGGTVTEDNPRSLLLNDDSVAIVYEPSSNMPSIGWVIALALLVIAAVLYFMFRRGLFRTFKSGGKGGGIPNA
ncbi:hypothetical protein [Paenibacillus spongiae]|uniref:DUF3153 domain-containing protein n=1 Tax=Paenibacillus spongiae TaxID=2909671 RepID=A0ABY5SEB6_9BACL|nr:hypothetical protein [Paenibacillus spongiae]UVI31107.1 hypothetical protein L1F29_04475 [Paenibacillus spongiae]